MRVKGNSFIIVVINYSSTTRRWSVVGGWWSGGCLLNWWQWQAVHNIASGMAMMLVARLLVWCVCVVCGSLRQLKFILTNFGVIFVKIYATAAVDSRGGG